MVDIYILLCEDLRAYDLGRPGETRIWDFKAATPLHHMTLIGNWLLASQTKLIDLGFLQARHRKGVEWYGDLCIHQVSKLVGRWRNTATGLRDSMG